MENSIIDNLFWMTSGDAKGFVIDSITGGFLGVAEDRYSPCRTPTEEEINMFKQFKLKQEEDKLDINTIQKVLDYINKDLKERDIEGYRFEDIICKLQPGANAVVYHPPQLNHIPIRLSPQPRQLDSDLKDKLMALLSPDFNDKWSVDGCQRHKATGRDPFTFCNGRPTTNSYICDVCMGKKTGTAVEDLFRNDTNYTPLKHRENIRQKRIESTKKKLASAGINIDNV